MLINERALNRENYPLIVMHLSMLSPRGGTPGICGAFDLFCLPHPREFDLESGPQGGDVCFFFATLTKKSSEKSNAPHMPGVPPLGLNIDRCITRKALLNLFPDPLRNSSFLRDDLFRI